MFKKPHIWGFLLRKSMQNSFLIIVILLIFQIGISSSSWEGSRDETVSLLKEYIDINTSNPPGDVRKAVWWIGKLLDKHSIDYQTFTVEEDPMRMHLLAEIKGYNNNLKPLLLLNHMDVVPADKQAWRVDPFKASVVDSVIYGRGSLDMKGMGIMQLMTLIQLKKEGWKPERTVKVLCVADEEVLGEYGAKWMIENHWDLLDPEWVWDEGGIGSKDSFPGVEVFAVAVAQKKSLWVDVIVKSISGHGSRPFDGHSNQVLANALSKIVSWKTPIDINVATNEMFKRVGFKIKGLNGFILRNINNPLLKYFFGSKVAKSSVSVNAMLRNTVSLTIMDSGYKVNVIPEIAKASLDIRLLPSQDSEEFINQLKVVINDSRVQIVPKRVPEQGYISSWESTFFSILSEEINHLYRQSVVTPFMSPGGTDSQYFQSKGVDCYGIIPVLVHEADIQTIHGINERISIQNLMNGYRIVYNTVKRVCGSNK